MTRRHIRGIIEVKNITGAKMIDILDVKKAIWDGELQVKIVRKNIILCDAQTGEAVKIGEVDGKED